MKYFLVLLAVTAVFARPLYDFDTSFEDNQQEVDKAFEDNQQEIETLNIEDDDTSDSSIISTSTRLSSINARKQALTSLIKSVIDQKLASQPGRSKLYKLHIYMIVHLFFTAVQMLYLSLPKSRILSIQKVNGSDLTLRPILDKIKIGNGQTARTSTMLAYRPNYNGHDHTRLGAVFLNLVKLFPCARTGIVPVCRRFTQDEDGFYKGKTIAEAADIGNNMRIFSTTKYINTYGFVFEACPYLNGVNSCLSTYFETVVTCFLPRSCL